MQRLAAASVRWTSGFWFLGAGLVVVLLGVAVCAAPALAFAVVGIVASIVLGLARPKVFFALGMFALVMQRTIALHVGEGVVGYLDEAFVAACAVLFVGRRLAHGKPLRSLPAQVPLALFLLLGAAASIMNAVPFLVAAQGMLLIAKGFILAWAVAQLDWQVDDIAAAARIGAGASVILIVGAVANFAAPQLWSSVVLAGQGYEARFGLTPVTSFFQHPGYFGTVMVLACLAAIAHVSVFGRSKTALFIIAGSAIAALLTARRKILVGLVAGITVLAIRLRWTSMLVFAIAVVPIAAILSWSSIQSVLAYTYEEYFVNPDAVARVRLTVDAFALATSSFPFGVGFGRFGSAVARQEYSPIYYELGYPGVWGLGPTGESGQFLTDTFWPAIVGETGLIGALCFIAILLVYIRYFVKLSRHKKPWDRWLGLVGIAWVVELTVESAAGAVFTAVPTFALFFALVGIASSRPLPTASSLGIANTTPYSSNFKAGVP